MAKASSPTKTSAVKGVSGNVGKELTKLAAAGERVQVIGSFKNGKLELDHTALAEIERKWPDAKIAFIAANAPFDPTPYTEDVAV
jgi:dihydrodipicolinate reductase